MLSEGLPLEKDALHLWFAIIGSEWDAATDEPILSLDERRRADRFHFDKDRRRFVFSRSLLRRLAGSYLEVAPQKLEFSYGPQNKPFLNGSDVHFNLAHSEDFVLLGFRRDHPIGVDIEALRPLRETADLVGPYFSERERARLSQAPPELREQEFLSLWTRKEAYLKALGRGLSHPLNEFDTCPNKEPHTWRIETSTDPAESVDWQIQDLFPAPGCIAAVAWEGAARLSYFRWKGGADGVAFEPADWTKPL